MREQRARNYIPRWIVGQSNAPTLVSPCNLPPTRCIVATVILLRKPSRNGTDKQKKVSVINIDKFVGEVQKQTAAYFRSEGFGEAEINQYYRVVPTNEGNGNVMVRVYAELSVDGCLELAKQLSKMASGYHRDLYFDLEEPGILVCVIDR